MASPQKEARRLFIYIHAIGVIPDLKGRSYAQYAISLQAQYVALPEELRSEARRRGREVIKQSGYETAAQLTPAPTPPQKRKNSRRAPRHQRKDLRIAEERELLLKMTLERSPGRCPNCLSRERGKRIWPCSEDAEAFRGVSGDPTLTIYKCPCDNGYHLGHQKAA